MKKWILAMAMALIWNAAAFAAGTQYELRVDGLACPYCAYGIEKKLKKTDGVETIDIDINNGVVKVNVAEGVTLTGAQMAKLINDAGFTLRGMTEKPQ
jgi:mercuric ion binding protein